MRSLRIAALCGLISAAALAGEYEDGVQKYGEGKYEAALGAFTRALEAGDNRAAFWLGEIHSRARGARQNFKEAAKWYRIGAGAGDASAQHGLAVLSRSGLGVPLDEKVAALWLRKAADQGHLDAQIELASMHLDEGSGIHDPSMAYAWAAIAARRGRPNDRDTRDELAGQARPAQVARGDQFARKWMVEFFERESALIPMPGAKPVPDFWVRRLLDANQAKVAAYYYVEAGERAQADVALLVPLLGRPEEETRGRAAAALAGIGASALPAILPLLKANERTVRWGAVAALREMGPDAAAAMEPLTAMLKDDDAAVRIETVKALGALGPKAASAVPVLAGVLRLQGSRSGEAAEVALMRIGPAAGPTLVEMLGDPSASLVVKAATLLGHSRAVPERAVPALLALILKDLPTSVQLAIVPALREYGPSSMKPLLARLDGGQARDRARTLELIHLIGVSAPEGVPVVVRLLDDPSERVRRNAALALGRLGPGHPATVPSLERAMRDKSRSVQNSAVMALGEASLESDLAFKALAATVTNEDPKIRAIGASMLGHKRMTPIAERVLPYLEVALKDEDPAVCANAVIGFTQIGSAAQKSIPALNEARKREDIPDWIRAELEVALEQLQAGDGR